MNLTLAPPLYAWPAHPRHVTARRVHLDGRHIGGVTTFINGSGDPRVWMSWYIQASERGNGYGRTAVTLALSAIADTPALSCEPVPTQVWAKIRPWNTPSVRLARAVGFTLTHDGPNELVLSAVLPAGRTPGQPGDN